MTMTVPKSVPCDTVDPGFNLLQPFFYNLIPITFVNWPPIYTFCISMVPYSVWGFVLTVHTDCMQWETCECTHACKCPRNMCMSAVRVGFFEPFLRHYDDIFGDSFVVYADWVKLKGWIDWEVTSNVLKWMCVKPFCEVYQDWINTS